VPWAQAGGSVPRAGRVPAGTGLRLAPAGFRVPRNAPRASERARPGAACVPCGANVPKDRPAPSPACGGSAGGRAGRARSLPLAAPPCGPAWNGRARPPGSPRNVAELTRLALPGGEQGGRVPRLRRPQLADHGDGGRRRRRKNAPYANVECDGHAGRAPICWGRGAPTRKDPWRAPSPCPRSACRPPSRMPTQPLRRTVGRRGGGRGGPGAAARRRSRARRVGVRPDCYPGLLPRLPWNAKRPAVAGRFEWAILGSNQ
jgi:hypothetical protein